MAFVQPFLSLIAPSQPGAAIIAPVALAGDGGGNGGAGLRFAAALGTVGPQDIMAAPVSLESGITGFSGVSGLTDVAPFVIAPAPASDQPASDQTVAIAGIETLFLSGAAISGDNVETAADLAGRGGDRSAILQTAGLREGTARLEINLPDQTKAPEPEPEPDILPVDATAVAEITQPLSAVTPIMTGDIEGAEAVTESKVAAPSVPATPIIADETGTPAPAIAASPQSPGRETAPALQAREIQPPGADVPADISGELAAEPAIEDRQRPAAIQTGQANMSKTMAASNAAGAPAIAAMVPPARSGDVPSVRTAPESRKPAKAADFAVGNADDAAGQRPTVASVTRNAAASLPSSLPGSTPSINDGAAMTGRTIQQVELTPGRAVAPDMTSMSAETKPASPNAGLEMAGASGQVRSGVPDGAAPAMPKAESALPYRSAEQPAAIQVGLGIARAVESGATRMTLHLSPQELGRVEIRMEFAPDGHMKAQVLASSADALDLLQRDMRTLERALVDAGIKTDGGSLNFSLNQQGGGAAGQQFAGFGQGQRADAMAAAPTHAETDAAGTAQDEQPIRLSARDGLDIRV